MDEHLMCFFSSVCVTEWYTKAFFSYELEQEVVGLRNNISLE